MTALHCEAEALSKPHGHHEARYYTSIHKKGMVERWSSFEALLGTKSVMLWHQLFTPFKPLASGTRPAIARYSTVGDEDPWNIIGSSMSVFTTFMHNAFPRRGAYF